MESGVPLSPVDRGNVNDGAAARLLHQWCDSLHAQEHADLVDFNDAPVVDQRHLRERLRDDDRGVVNQDVQAAVAVAGLFDQGCPSLLVGDIEMAVRAALKRPRGVLALVIENVGRDDGRPLGREERRLRGPLAAGGASDQGDFVCQSIGHGRLPADWSAVFSSARTPTIGEERGPANM